MQSRAEDKTYGRVIVLYAEKRALKWEGFDVVRPILFNTEMVMAILRNEKTSTRSWLGQKVRMPVVFT